MKASNSVSFEGDKLVIEPREIHKVLALKKKN
ncbi:hypothetical protein BACT_0160 [Bifidobacterium actinocoloniiforme DSM 22766]|uniref:Uncharacterized protein n=1 Tax=Bifidobacterium actinocoloniiforme DSM 22766 TaxID=1437605 RepID=A0A086YYI0_9BIFI|nr:hypothetical protein BACT_0160 [Bifidobacterium actinocoloniiforme DSM 22766]